MASGGAPPATPSLFIERYRARLELQSSRALSSLFRKPSRTLILRNGERWPHRRYVFVSVPRYLRKKSALLDLESRASTPVIGQLHSYFADVDNALLHLANSPAFDLGYDDKDSCPDGYWALACARDCSIDWGREDTPHA
ncbi:uncharacterized protein SPSK_03678 [Sporothrix schenckii 1099-18]|uniref:Uncharacterized protein n=1 Tax=Sporothrix schenckii 1099-18 TaxID=1397361 RepID=A0A0F2M342_SPOSC|nr:uncharacterized protein SPSK_03678 [Sporothrix schenckii 1099-18]KJR82556.1 hypothetical protein SPSK_03678 [Sporothrix schenckii 1099-18]